jgi:hypothetical protein
VSGADPSCAGTAAPAPLPCDVCDALTAPAPAFAMFDWLMGPLSPGLLMRIWMTMFCAPCWIADAIAAAACCVAAAISVP